MSNQRIMSDKVCLVTGATSGIGKATALALAQQGATVVIGGRNQEKCSATVQEIQQQSGNSAIEYILADMSSLQDVRRMAATFLERHQRLDVLINNAGAIYFKRQTSVDGYDLMFATNYLGPFLLTNLLLETLKASAPSRIINVSSVAHKSARFDIDDPQKFGSATSYYNVKFALILFTYELARRLQGTGVTVNALNPGYVWTNMGMNNGLLGKVVFSLTYFLGHGVSPAEGAQTSVYLATSPEVEGITGKYYSDMKAIPSIKQTYNEAWAKRLWETSEKMIAASASRS